MTTITDYQPNRCVLVSNKDICIWIKVILTWFNSADFGKVELQILAELNFTILWLLTLAQLNFWAFLSRVLQYRYESIPLVQLGRPLVQLCHLKVNLNYCSLTSTMLQYSTVQRQEHFHWFNLDTLWFNSAIWKDISHWSSTLQLYGHSQTIQLCH